LASHTAFGWLPELLSAHNRCRDPIQQGRHVGAMPYLRHTLNSKPPNPGIALLYGPPIRGQSIQIDIEPEQAWLN
jgi:hypothetical protein